MNLLSTLPLAMAAVAVYVGFWHWRVFARGDRQREHLFFALLCLGVGLYDVSASGSYAGGALGDPALWQRLQNLAVGVVGSALLWFVYAYTRRGSRRVAWALTAYYAVHGLMLLLVWNEWVFRSTRHVTTVILPWGGHVVYDELRHGALLQVSSLAHGATILIALLWTARFLATASSEERGRARRLAVGIAVFLAGALNDLAVTHERYSFLYLLEYAYLGLILVMTAGMSTAVLELARTRSELRSSHARLRRIFENVNEVYIEATLDGRILEVSPSISRWFGEGVELRGQPALRFFARPEDHDALMAALQGHGRVVDFATAALLPDGRTVDCASNLAVVVDEETGERRIVGSIRDVTEEKRAQAERRSLEQRMQQAQKLESLGLLAGGIAHDFNNLLTGILGSAELALVELEPDHRARQRVEAIRPIARRATDLCRELLAYSGRARFDVAPVDLSTLVEEMDELLGLSLPRTTRLERELPAGLPAVVADATQIRQIVLNLVINAGEALNGAGTVTIRTALSRRSAAELASEYVSETPPAGDYVLLEVTDTGPGMSEAVRRHLFEPFFTTKFSGRGLGLSAVLGIVRAHRGTVQVESEPGRGSTFRLLLPAAAAAVVEPPGPPPERQWRGHGRVLLVDDEPAVREVSTAILEHLGFEVTPAEGGRDAIELFRGSSAEFALAIVDLTMPDLGGVEVVRELQRIRPGTPVLVASGYSEEEGTTLLAQEGVRGFLAKPFSIEELRRRIRAVLEP